MTREAGERVPQILVVDDQDANAQLLAAYLEPLDCAVMVAGSGPAALELIERHHPDLVLLDVQMPGMNGFEVCRRIRSTAATQLLPVVMVTALHSTHDRVSALDAGADDFLTKPVERVELVARARAALKLKAAHDQLNSAERVIFALAAAVEAKDAHTEAHTERVGQAARRIAAAMGLSPRDREAAYLGGKVHDVGKIGIPDAVLGKPGQLDDAEWEVMRQHPVMGEKIVQPLQSAAELAPIVRSHHEAWDGGGYPDGLKGESIPLLARVVAVCDAFDSMVSDRPYRPARSRAEAEAVLSGGSGRQWDPRLVDLMLSGVAG